MKRHLASTATALLLSVGMCLQACSDSATPAGEPGPAEGGPGDPDGSVDGKSPDGTKDGAVDGAIDAPPVDAGPPAVRFVGRFDKAAAGGPKVAWPGAQIIARFSGTAEVKASFDDAMLYVDYGGDRWEVLLDGVSTKTLQLTRAVTTYSLASGLTPGPHTVELVKLTEGSVGTTQFRDFDFVGGTLLPPPLPRTRRMQFLGDSASNGFGIDGAPGCSFSASNENERKSYPALVARDLSADHHNLSASGKGLYQNNYRPDTEVFSLIYPRVGVHVDSPLWNHADYSPDVVWMTLGGIDYGDPDGNPNNPPDVPPPGAFQTKYDQLVGTIRTQHPNAHVFCAIAPSLTNDYPPGYNAYTNVKTAATRVVTTRVAAGDTKLFVFEFTRSADGDLTACDGHPNIAKHRSMANEAVTFIKSKTGW